MTFYLIRHGETNEKGFYGIKESCLSSNGRNQIKALLSYFNNKKIDLILTSPRKRARETATIIDNALRARVVINDRLREINFGNWEGKDFEQIKSDFPEDVNQFLNHVDIFQFPEGESIKGFCKNVDQTWKILKENYENQCIIIVSHCVWIKAVLRNYYGQKFLVSGKVPHAELFEVDIKKNIAIQGGENKSIATIPAEGRPFNFSN